MEPAERSTIVSTATTLSGLTTGRLTVRPATSLTIEGEHDGSVELEGDAELVVLGTLRGRLEIGSLATARVAGTMSGPVDIRIAGTLIIETAGSITGSISNFGSFTNLGTRSGHVEGRSPDDRPGSVVKPG